MPKDKDTGFDFASLSIRDLLEARDLYHFHLLNKANVIGTAIGRYLIRDEESWPSEDTKGQGVKGERTLKNASVRDYSWPCVLVFVQHWLTDDEFHAKTVSLSDFVPSSLYLADGREVPVCVVAVHPSETDPNEQTVQSWPQNTFGGGMRVSVEMQQAEHFASVGCLVSDGSLTYAVTARHVCGEPGTPLQGTLRGGAVRIGVSSVKQITRKPFTEVYPAFAARQTFLNLDVGLIEIDDINQWTCNVFGLPPIESIYDIYEQNLSLRLIDQDVVAFGAASGYLRGQIKALFYRYRSVGGHDYVCDFLIAPRAQSPNSRHGDSGTIWHIDLSSKKRSTDPEKDAELRALPILKHELHPLAIQWGGQTLVDGSAERVNFALATSLSNVCKLLDVELVTDHNTGVSGYWGRTGHYSIGNLAIGLIGNAKLKSFFAKNAENLSFALDKIEKKSFDSIVRDNLKTTGFSPLADVPDDIWKQLPPSWPKGRAGGRDIKPEKPFGSTGPEHPNHYADIDVPYGGKTLRALCLAKPGQYLTLSAWKAFYAALAKQADDAGDHALAKKRRDLFKQGILPFRVWQFFDQMVAYATAGDHIGFLTAAGTLAHYVGDACQPLHGSYLADGDPARMAHRTDKDGKPVIYGKGVHSAYETQMLGHNSDDLIPRLQHALPNAHGLQLVADGAHAAYDLIKTMDDVANILDPMDIVELYETLGAPANTAGYDKMWAKLGDATVQVMAVGIRHLAMLWEAAWVAGNGDAIPASKLDAIDPGHLRELYEKAEFMHSYTIDDIATAIPAAVGAGGPPVPSPAPAGHANPKKTGKPAKKKKTSHAKR